MAELRQLRAFVTVAEELNFTRAAVRLHIAQQAVSKAVRQLEAALGVELLHRTSREVRLTEAGATLLISGRDVLAAADDAFARTRAVGRGLAGTVRVGVSPALGPGERDQVTAVLRAGAPDLAVSLHEVRPGEIAQALRDRAIDLALARTTPSSPAVHSAALGPTPAVIAVPDRHRLAGGGRVALAELDGERLLTWSPRGTPYTDLLLARLAAAGAHVEPVESRITGSGSLPELGARAAIAIVPADWPLRDGITFLAVHDDLTLPLVLLWLAGSPPPAAERVLERMKQATRPTAAAPRSMANAPAAADDR